MHKVNIMTEFTWKNNLSIGNELLDAEHKILIDIVNSAETAIISKKSDALSQAINLLLDKVFIHFENEERIAAAINTSFSEHKMEHQYVINELRNMRDELANRRGRWSESAAEHYSYFLSAWLYEHLTEEPKALKPALQNYPYSFDPILVS
jgi:hemerythrin